jgi:hypothetical protein
MRLKLKICKINTKCNECGIHLVGKQAVIVAPNLKTFRTGWLLCGDCLLATHEAIVSSEEFDFVRKALEGEL